MQYSTHSRRPFPRRRLFYRSISKERGIAIRYGTINENINIEQTSHMNKSNYAPNTSAAEKSRNLPSPTSK